MLSVQPEPIRQLALQRIEVLLAYAQSLKRREATAEVAALVSIVIRA
ncbi:hypothetical protein [Methylobacterium nigriterrae]